MTAAGHQRIYRGLTRLYPNEFRNHYRDDLVQQFSDLVTRDGSRRAWVRTALDLIVTVPRYRLEIIMSTTHSTTTLNITIAALAAGGVLSVLTGIYPGALLIIAAAVVALTQRSQLARSLRTPDSNQRTRRLRMSALSAAVFAACVVAYFIVVWDEEASTVGLLVPSLLGTAALIGAIAYLIGGLLTPKSSSLSRAAPHLG